MVTIKKIAQSAAISRRILLYSDSGAGKTHLAGTTQDVVAMADTLVVDMDGGSKTLASRGDVSGVEARLPKDVEEVLWMLRRKDPQVAHIKTLVLDGASELQKRDLAEIAAEGAAKKSSRNQDLNEIQDYKLAKARFIRLIRTAREIDGINLIVTCWAKKTFPKIPGTEQQNKTAMPTLICPDLSDSVKDVILGYFDDIWYLFQDPATSTRYLVTSTYGVVQAKTRDEKVAASLTSVIENKTVPMLANPTFGTIYAAIKTAYGVK